MSPLCARCCLLDLLLEFLPQALSQKQVLRWIHGRRLNLKTQEEHLRDKKSCQIG